MGQRSTWNLFEFRHSDVQDDWSEWLDEEKWYEMQEVAELSDRMKPNVDVEGLYYSTVLTAGDCLVIPPGWWHQSYGLEPSMSISSLRCGTTQDVPMAIQKILSGIEGQGKPALLEREEFDDNEDAAVKVIKALFDFLDKMKTL